MVGIGLSIAHVDVDFAVHDLERVGLQWNEGGHTNRLAGAYVETALVKWTLHDAIDQDTVGQIGTFMSAATAQPSARVGSTNSPTGL